MRLLLKFGETNEVVGMLTFDRDPTVVGPEQRRFILTGYSGSSEYAPSERDTDVYLRIYGFDQVEWSTAEGAIETVEGMKAAGMEAAENARVANEENKDGPPHPDSLPLVAAEDGKRMNVHAPAQEEGRSFVPDASGDQRVVEKEGARVDTDEGLQAPSNFPVKAKEAPEPAELSGTGNVPSAEGREAGQEVAPRSGTSVSEFPGVDEKVLPDDLKGSKVEAEDLQERTDTPADVDEKKARSSTKK